MRGVWTGKPQRGNEAVPVTRSNRSLPTQHINVHPKKEPSSVRANPGFSAGRPGYRPLVVRPEISFLDDSASKCFICSNFNFYDGFVSVDDTPAIIKPTPNTFNPFSFSIDNLASCRPSTEVLGQYRSISVCTCPVGCCTRRQFMDRGKKARLFW